MGELGTQVGGTMTISTNISGMPLICIITLIGLLTFLLSNICGVYQVSFLCETGMAAIEELRIFV